MTSHLDDAPPPLQVKLRRAPWVLELTSILVVDILLTACPCVCGKQMSRGDRVYMAHAGHVGPTSTFLCEACADVVLRERARLADHSPDTIPERR